MISDLDPIIELLFTYNQFSNVTFQLSMNDMQVRTLIEIMSLSWWLNILKQNQYDIKHEMYYASWDTKMWKWQGYKLLSIPYVGWRTLASILGFCHPSIQRILKYEFQSFKFICYKDERKMNLISVWKFVRE